MKITDISDTPAKRFIRDMYQKYPRNPLNSHEFYMTFNDDQLALFHLSPGVSGNDYVHIHYFRTNPVGSGIGRKAMLELLKHAREAGVNMDLIVSDKNKNRLTRFYRSLGFSVDSHDHDLMTWRSDEQIQEAEFDPRGWGSTPNSVNIDYFGLQVKMRPSVFLKLATPLRETTTNSSVATYMERGGKIAYPFLEIKDPLEWSEGDFSNLAKVTGHEGRNRMTNWIRLHGDEPVTVYLFLRGANRRRYITQEMIDRLSDGLINQVGDELIRHPFESETALEESTELVNEIESISASDYYGLLDSDYRRYDVKQGNKILKKLSGYSEFYWYYNDDKIVIVKESESKSDKLNAVAVLFLDYETYPQSPKKNVARTGEISVHKDFRGMGLGNQLYLLAMMPSPMGIGKTIMSGESQTPGGRARWRALRANPNIEVVGFCRINEDNKILKSQKFLDDLFGKVGAVYVGKVVDSRTFHYFEFPVDSNNNNVALDSVIKTYNPLHYILSYADTGLIARYIGK